MKEFVQNENNLAIAYYRYSSASQNDASIEQQREAAHGYAAAHGLSIIAEYEDRAISGTTDQRPGFQQMLSEVARLRPSAVILWKTDRLGRDRFVLAAAKKQIREAGCAIHLVAEVTPQDSPEGVLVEGLLDSMAEYYSRQLSVNVRRGMGYNAANCLANGRPPYGYAVDDAKRFIIDPATAPVVQRIFGDYASGKGMREIADALYKEGHRSASGGRFTINSLRGILKNRRYLGIYIFRGEETPGGMPQLVDQKTFDLACKRLRENRRHGCKGDDHDYWLTPKLRCGTCGEPMAGVHGTGKSKRKYYYYACSAQRKHLCDRRPMRQAKLEDAVMSMLRGILTDFDSQASLAVDASYYYWEHYGDTGYLDSLYAKLNEAEASQKNLVSAIEKGAFSDAIRDRIAALEEQIKGLCDSIDAEEARERMRADEHSITAYFNRYASANLDDPKVRDAVLDYFIDRIYVYDDHIFAVGRFDGDHYRVDLGPDDEARFEFVKPHEEYFEYGVFPDDDPSFGFDSLPSRSAMWSLQVFGIPEDLFLCGWGESNPCVGRDRT